jgi:hypothetical protein
MSTMRFNKFMPLIKVDATNRTITGLITSERPDKTGEVCDYKSSKPYYQDWSNEFSKATGGHSMGNLREMHGLKAVGKFTDLLFDDSGKKITGTAKVVDDDAWNKCVEGVYTGFSHGGDYVGEPKKEGKYKRYTAKPTEISLVDNPCNSDAHFEFVKADGGVELRKFAQVAVEEDEEPVSDITVEKMTVVELTDLIKSTVEESLAKHDRRGASDVQPDDDTVCPHCGKNHSKCKCEKKAGAFCANCGKEHAKCKCEKKAGDRLEDKDEAGICPHCGEKDEKCKCDVEKLRRAWVAAHKAPTDAVKKAAIATVWKKKVHPAGPPSAEAMSLAVTSILAKTLSSRYDLTDAQTEQVFALDMEKGMNHLARMAQILLDTAWLKWSVSQEQSVETDSASILPASLQEDLSKMADTLVDMAKEETQELIANSQAGQPPDEPPMEQSSLNMLATVPGLFRAMPLGSAESELFKAMGEDGEEIELFKANPDYDDGYGGYEHTQPCLCHCPSCVAGNCAGCSAVDAMSVRGEEVAPTV